jgi:hypothetical protein
VDSIFLGAQRPPQSSPSGNNNNGISCFFERSSSFSKNPLPAPLDNPSQEYSRIYAEQQERSRDGFLSTIKMEQRRESMGMGMECELMDDLWREDKIVQPINPNIESMCMIDNTRFFQPEDPFRVSFDFGNESMLMRNRTSIIKPPRP